MKLISTVIFILIASMIFAQVPKHKRSYKIFNKKGRKVSYRKLIKKAAKADVVLFGELHNNSIAHWLELSMAKDLSEQKNLIIGTEMIERDNQNQVNDYLAGQIDDKALDTLARLPSNYKTDYKPILDFAKAKNIPFICSNIPRRFASIVFKKGFEGLSKLSVEEKSWAAPLPIKYDPELPGYQAMLEMMGGHGGANLPKAQAIKDATMAHFILKERKEGSLFFHFNGSYHSNNYEGIGWYLKRNDPKLKMVTVAVVTQADLKKLSDESIGIADFIICVDEDVTDTY